MKQEYFLGHEQKQTIFITLECSCSAFTSSIGSRFFIMLDTSIV